MAALVDKTMGALNEARKPMYPLFEKPQKPLQPQPNKSDPSTQQTPPENAPEPNVPLSNASSREIENTRNHAARESSKFGGPTEQLTTIAASTGGAGLLDVDPNHERRKRRKTDSPKAKESPKVNGETTPQRQSLPVDQPSNDQIQQVQETGIVDASNKVPISAISDELERSGCGSATDISKERANASKTLADYDEIKPKKILRLNPKTGTIGSPPAKKKDHQIEVASKTSRPSRSKQPMSRIVIICYRYDKDHPSDFGSKINQILEGSQTAALTANVSTANHNPKTRKVLGANPGAAPHPFFLGKVAAQPGVPEAILPVPETVENGPLKIPTNLDVARSKSPRKQTSKPSVSTFAGFGRFGGGTAKILKFPGAVEPAWPWKGMTHVRGNNGTPDRSQPSNGLSNLLSRPKKSKYQAVEIFAGEDVIGTLATELCVAQVVKSVREVNIDEYPPPPACLRIPARHFAAGHELQKRVRKELSTRLPPSNANKDGSVSEDEIQETFRKNAQAHPALTNIYNTIATSLSAFDQSRCETQPWTHKYSPNTTAEVLQTGREALILREWLQTLTVKSVETGGGDRSQSRASSVSRRSTVSGKRKHKSKKLDGFVVSSDEESDMDEISEPEEDVSLRANEGLLKRTVVRTGNAATKGSARLANAVVVSGPHGCGKTAAVYAVAKELGFEVFEINSTSRRSGKDIMEKVGDMTHNHLVQSSNSPAPAEPVDEDARRIADALEDDLKSGRQGTMNSFFKPKESTKAKSKPIKSHGTPKPGANKPGTAPKAPPKQQKQSLILFEEVDVLYEEDKQFWATIMAMIVQSKRPIIMTCTDESSVPFISLTLHAIIRFTPPPVDLATDYMLLVAANEGHLIRRDAVKSLYESRGLDLRASLTELNFWCQFAVGDFKGGLEWLYPRWPPGIDVDEYGNTIRVISEGTYETGMGWLSQDFLESQLSYLDIEEEILHEAWDGWHLDVGDWEKSLDMAAFANKMQSQPKGKIDDAAALSMYDDFLDAMSAADLCSGGAFAPENEIMLDVTLPTLSSKVREDYILSYELLEAAPLVNFQTIGEDISLWMKSRARKCLQVDQHVKCGFKVPPELDHPSEPRIIELIKDKFCSPESCLIRQDFSLAFDPISETQKTSLYSTGYLEASSFDRTLSLLTIDVAPYVRSIVAYDLRLQQDRTRLSNLMSEGGRQGKKMRTTRSAMSALEGGARSTTRRDRYFGAGLNPHFVLKTGMQSWLDAMFAQMESVRKEDKEIESVDELMEDCQ